MRACSRLSLLLAVLACTAFSVHAETRSGPINDATRAARVGAEQASHRQLLVNRTVAPKSGNAVNASVPALPRANPVRAYPPSCLADPLPDETSGPTWRSTVDLAAYDSETGDYLTERVAIVLWRVACSSSSLFTSATLMRIERQDEFEGDQVVYPLFPAIRINQGTTDVGDDDFPANLIRTPIEPNTVLADTLTDTPVVFNTTYVLENYDSSAAGYFDFNLAFRLRFDNGFSSSNLFFIQVPTYNPTAGSYPAAFQDMPISGFLGTSWYEPGRGDGIVLEMFEPLNNTQTFVISFTWSTYAPNGSPFWLGGQVEVPRGTRSVTAPLFYRTGGSINGDLPGPPIPWGVATIRFRDCNHMTYTFVSNPGLPMSVPSGSGTRNWVRLANINGLTCE